MKITDIAFSSYAVTDVKRARNFYEGVLGLTPATIFEKDSMAFIEYEIGQHWLSIGAGAPAFVPGPQGGVIVFEVDEFKPMVEKIRSAGVSFVMEPQDTGACHMALIEDPDHNRIMIHKRK